MGWIDLDTTKEWIVPALATLVSFFMIRFIRQRDKFETSIELKFAEHTDKSNKSMQGVAGEMRKHAESFGDAVLEMKKEAADIKKANLDFQLRIQDDLGEIKKHTIGIDATIRRTATKASELEGKLDRNLEQIDTINHKVSKHDEAVDGLMKVVQTHEVKIKKQERAIKKMQ